MKKTLLTLFLFSSVLLCNAKGTLTKDIPYRPENQPGTERCRLDVYAPDSAKNLPVVIWWHGGGLTGGNKNVPKELRDDRAMVIAPAYRLMPAVPIDSCLSDAAAAVAWAVENASRFGGDPRRIIISGHSAGAYLSLMMALDKQWLAAHGIDADSLEGVVALSPQTITHFAHRDNQGIKALTPTIDKYAPLYHVRGNAAPITLITGDAELELYGRYEENAYLWRMLRLNGHTSNKLLKVDGFDHGTMVRPGLQLLRRAY